MSDDEYYSDENNSESEDSDNDVVVSTKSQLPIGIKYGIGSKKYKDDADIDDADVDDADVDDEDKDVDDMDGGGDSELEEGEIEESDADDDDTASVASKSDESDIEVDEEGEIIESSKNAKSSNKPKKKQLLIQEEDEEEDEYDENYLQKFDNDIIKNYVNDFHPECLNHNYDEIAKMSIIIKNSEGIIIDPLHKTIPYLTKYERARILGQRAKQIEIGAKPLVKVPENIIDSYIIAELELREKKIPFIIRRPIPGGGCEYWNIKDLEIIAF